MVSFRYHVVSVVAVFLALGLGVLMGTTVVKQSVIDNLRTQAQAALNQSHRLQKDVTDLGAELRQWDSVAAAFQHLLVSGQLLDHSVVLLTADGVAPSVIDGVRRAMGDAGASVSAVLRVTSKMGLADEGPRAQLAQDMGLPDTTATADL